MSVIFTIFRPEGDLYITIETLAVIRLKLLEALKQMQPPEDYAHLVQEIESGNAEPMIFEDGASIGGWKLIYSEGRLMLERQQMPRASLMLFYVAWLEWRNEQWQVLSINIKTVRGH